MRFLSTILTGLLLTALATGAGAQSLAGRHRLGLNLGYWSQTASVRVETVSPDVSTSVQGDGFLGGVTYGYWLGENLALTIEAGALALDTETRVTSTTASTSSAVVGAVLFGLEKYVSGAEDGSSVRPHLGGAVGLYRGSQSEVVAGLTSLVEAREESSFGGRLSAGVDFLVGRSFMMGAAIGYNLMSDFDRPVGGSVNYSGPQMSFGFSLLLGGGKANR